MKNVVKIGLALLLCASVSRVELLAGSFDWAIEKVDWMTDANKQSWAWLAANVPQYDLQGVIYDLYNNSPAVYQNNVGSPLPAYEIPLLDSMVSNAIVLMLANNKAWDNNKDDLEKFEKIVQTICDLTIGGMKVALEAKPLNIAAVEKRANEYHEFLSSITARACP